MRIVIPAGGAVLEQILDTTFPVWGEGLERAGYGRYNEAQCRTPWGIGHLHRFALVEDGRWLSTAKRYDLRVVLDGETLPAIGIGAVFTPPPLRRRGFASDLLRRMLDEASVEGYRFAMLFSEISPRFYEALGFTSVPVRQHVLDVATLVGSPGIAIRSGEPRDLAAIVEMNRLQAEGARFFLDRDTDYAAFAQAKKRLLAACGQPGHRQVEFFAVEEGGRAAAYLVILQVNDSWMVTECGDRDPTGARVGAMLQSVLARGNRPPKRIRAWLPPNFVPPQVRLAAREVPPLTMMVRTLGPLPPAPKLGVGEICWWHGDAF